MKFYIERLGCPKNDVDADYMTARLLRDGHSLASTADDAEAVIVNTCGFILPAKQESIGQILEHAQRRKDGSLKRLIAAGCLSQRNGDELLAEIPELDSACGLGALDQISLSMNGAVLNSGLPNSRRVQKIETRNLSYLSDIERFVDCTFPFAYLKISDGCDRKCSYCVIPQMRGSFRSRRIEDIVSEARFLASKGKRELILVSQEATLYGGDIYGKVRLVELLRQLEEIEEICWIRLVYLHPQMLKADLIDYISKSHKTLPYYDLPIQHIHDDMLSRMRRQVRREKIERVLAEIRSKRPDCTIRTTFIVGFPGETESHFGELYEFAESFKFDRMGAFAYSQEEGSSAALMPDQVPEEDKALRLDALSELQSEIVASKNRELIGKEMTALIDSVSEETSEAVGRTMADCPEIDPVIRVRQKPNGDKTSAAKLKSGDMVRVRVTETDGTDLIAELRAA